MEVAGDLTAEALAAALPGREIRAYPALLSTEAEALAWARSGAPQGAIVAAGYQASPRGRSGREWTVAQEASLVFSLVLRPQLPATREGWVYTVAVSGLADAVGSDARIAWPDEVRTAGRRAGAVGVQTGLGPQGIEWAVVNVLVERAPPPRPPLLARVVERIEERSRATSAAVLRDYLARCDTIGRCVRARLIPLGPGGPEVTGTAISSLPDGALLLETGEGRRIAVRPQGLGVLDDA